MSEAKRAAKDGKTIDSSAPLIADLEQVDLKIEGMTCSSCVATVERALNKVPGAQATVNLATESAHILAPRGISTKDLLDAVKSSGYTAKLRTDVSESFANSRNLGWRLGLALLLTVPVIVLSMWHSIHYQIEDLILEQLARLAIPAPLYSATGWLVIGLSAPVVLILAWPIHRAALRNLVHPTMDNLISLGSLTAFIWSVYANSTGAGEIYAEVAASVVTFIMFGRYLEAIAKRRAGSALAHLLSLSPKEVRILRGNEEVTAPIANLMVGDRCVVRPGERFPVDGTVIEGVSSVDNSLLTGESLPIEIMPGALVIAGSINQSGRIVIEAQRVGSDTELSRITKMVLTAQAEKAPIQKLADRISSVFVPTVLLLSIATLTTWLVLGNELAPSISAAVALLVIACPCALGLATPVALLVASGKGAANGIIFRRTSALEIAPEINTVVLDKTGTVTSGSMRVHHELFAPLESLPVNRHEIEMAVLGIERESSHPVARAIAEHLAQTGIGRKSFSDLVETPGQGVAARVGFADRLLPVLVGTPESIKRATLSLHPILEDGVAAARAAGHSVAVVAIDGVAVALYEVGDSIRPDSAGSIEAMRSHSLDIWMISGDNQAAAHRVAQAVGIEDSRLISESNPEGKIELVKRLRAEGRRVLMIGDGVNDAAALSAADLSMAMGTGTDTAIASADITLLRGSLDSAITALTLAKKTLRVIKGNLGWAFIYNLIGMPIAALGYLSPMYAGGAMAMSSLLVVLNSLRLNRPTSLAA
jgi:Cu+-exporting ATPase